MAKHLAKAKRELRRYKAKECKFEATGSLRRRPTFAVAKVFAAAKQNLQCSEEADKVQDQSLVRCCEANVCLSKEVRQGKAGLLRGKGRTYNMKTCVFALTKKVGLGQEYFHF